MYICGISVSMEIRELRAGNLINRKRTGVVTVGIGTFVHTDNNKDDYYSGIELSEEWLERFGFRIWGHNTLKMAALKISDVLEFEYDLVKKELSICYDDHEIEGQWSCIPMFHIKYVHQLQNLYYVLTNGEELVLNGAADLGFNI